MDQVPLARLWHLSDGTSCVLYKNARENNWQVRVVRGDVTIRSEAFDSPLVAMNIAKEWRATYDPSAERAR